MCAGAINPRRIVTGNAAARTATNSTIPTQRPARKLQCRRLMTQCHIATCSKYNCDDAMCVGSIPAIIITQPLPCVTILYYFGKGQHMDKLLTMSAKLPAPIINFSTHTEHNPTLYHTLLE